MSLTLSLETTNVVSWSATCEGGMEGGCVHVYVCVCVNQPQCEM